VVSDEPTTARLLVNFAVGTVGAVFGAGTVYGTTKQRLSSLEGRMTALEAQQQKDTSEIHTEIGELRADLKDDLKAMRQDLKDDIKELRGLILTRREP
jgi:BMFP domain-containing protein YqiC